MDREEQRVDKLQRLVRYVTNALGHPANEFGLRELTRHDMASLLCYLCQSMDGNQQSAILYDGRNATARELADWWDVHKAQDAECDPRDPTRENVAAGRSWTMADVYLLAKSPETLKALQNLDAQETLKQVDVILTDLLNKIRAAVLSAKTEEPPE